MENEVAVFQNQEFGEIRTLTRDGEPWFVGTGWLLPWTWMPGRNTSGIAAGNAAVPQLSHLRI